ncbi:hypothetical protein GCM10012288_17190 [Malaciobacter pacificus]|jgi:hypothetical protein|uniref:Uncharacterized protein n=1 Tax=Malaciobacter pacificus TaxID=1080223 RepID=A0A5C2HDQ9_9BACT|nr:hypothetical protein [Malaciobacter pacificus]QEP34904.1 hypothetical protein APAC_1823 [Malaciobacter pacificus]GGD43447.1 hypothetical protein GCM10012288_17190 [Malaciobacter pacificus]
MLNQENKDKLNQLEIFKDKVDFQFHDGWTDLIYELGTNITELCKLTNCELPHMQQIKTKFGTLRFYCNTLNSEYPKVVEKCINLLVKSAQDKSSTMCEYCGKRGELRTTGLWFTACEDHKGDSITEDEFRKLQELNKKKKKELQ